MNCEIISTGASAGNAVLLNGCLLFDCGVSWYKLKDYEKQTDWKKCLQITYLTKDSSKI